MNRFRDILKSFRVPSGSSSALVLLTTIGVGTYGAYKSIVTIQPGHIGIVYNRVGGLQDNFVLRDGINFLIPWFQRAVVYDVRTRPQLVNTQSGSKGLLV